MSYLIRIVKEDIRVATDTFQVITASSFAAIMVASFTVGPSWVVAFDRAYPSIAKDSLATTSSSTVEVTASSEASPSLVAASDPSWVVRSFVVGPYRAFVPTCFALVTSVAASPVVIASWAVTSLASVVATFQPP